MSNALYFVKGVNGQLEVFEDKVVITRKGAMSFSTHGLAGGKTIPMSAIQSVQFKPGGGMTNGFIQFAVMGGRESQGGLLAATRDENTVVLRMGEQTVKGEEIRDYVEKSAGVITAICPIIGYEKSAEIAKRVVSNNITVKEALLDEGLFDEQEIERLIEPSKLINYIKR